MPYQQRLQQPFFWSSFKQNHSMVAEEQPEIWIKFLRGKVFAQLMKYLMILKYWISPCEGWDMFLDLHFFPTDLMIRCAWRLAAIISPRDCVSSSRRVNVSWLSAAIQMHYFGLFPECVARVPVSPWGWGCVRNRWQPFAWPPQGPPYARTQLEWCRKCVKLTRDALVILEFAEEVFVCDLWRRGYIGVWRGGVCVSDLWRRSYFGVSREGVSVSDLWRRSFFGVCRRNVYVSCLWHRSLFGVCRGGVCVSDLWRRRFAEEVSVWVPSLRRMLAMSGWRPWIMLKHVKAFDRVQPPLSCRILEHFGADPKVMTFLNGCWSNQQMDPTSTKFWPQVWKSFYFFAARRHLVHACHDSGFTPRY